MAVVERKSLDDLVSTIGGGKLWMLLAALSEQPHAAVVVEDRYSQIFKLTYRKPAMISETLAEAAARYPGVPIVFTETRALAQELVLPVPRRRTRPPPRQRCRRRPCRRGHPTAS